MKKKILPIVLPTLFLDGFLEFDGGTWAILSGQSMFSTLVYFLSHKLNILISICFLLPNTCVSVFLCEISKLYKNKFRKYI